jgi:hypothetical protein
MGLNPDGPDYYFERRKLRNRKTPLGGVSRVSRASDFQFANCRLQCLAMAAQIIVISYCYLVYYLLLFHAKATEEVTAPKG